MATEFSFLDRDANQELGNRIARRRSEEEQGHQRRSGDIHADHHKRHLTGTSLYFTALWHEELIFRRLLAAAARDEVFELVEAQAIRLKDRDINCIRTYLAGLMRHSIETVEEQLDSKAKRISIPWGTHAQRQAQVNQAVGDVVTREVDIRVAELQRSQRHGRRKWWGIRIEKLLWIVVGPAIGVLGTLVVQWLLQAQ